MPGHILHNVIAPQPLHMRNLPASNATEELVEEADEPPDNRYSHVRTTSFPDGDFTKHLVPHSPPVESLLSRALLTSPSLRPMDRMPRNNPARGMSTSSIWSNASTAELTSDGLTTPSRTNTPSPPPPLYLTGIASLLNAPKPRRLVPEKIEQVEIASSTTGGHDSSDCQGRRRRITFAMDRRHSDDGGKPVEGNTHKPEPAPKRPGLTFVCNQSEARRNSLQSPTQSSNSMEIRGRSMSTSTATGVSTFPNFNPFARPGSIGFYDSEDPNDSWTHEPFDRTRLLKVDDVLKKERDIRKLSEEAEAEDMEDDEEQGLDDDDDDATSVGDDEEANSSDMEDEHEAEDGDEDDDADSYDGESGNETDNEEGFGDDESDDELFFTHAHRQPLLIPIWFSEPPYPPLVYHEPPRSPCCRSHSDTSTDWQPRTAPRRIRPPPPELPDSTDFVCGTLDEDKPLEQAYASCLEERKRSKHKPVPQDIDPSFPTSDPEESDNGQAKPRNGKSDHGRPTSPVDVRLKGKRRDGGRSPPLRGRVHSPAPIRRRAQSPAPIRRSNNNSPLSRPASPGTRRGRAVSPTPIQAPAGRVTFNSGHNIERTRSLPRTGGCPQRTYRSTKHHTSTSPRQVATRPVLIRRGAMDIYKGLEKRRERRKARLQRKDKDCDWKAGAGVEKMRELGLEVCGKGKARPAQWVISA